MKKQMGNFAECFMGVLAAGVAMTSWGADSERVYVAFKPGAKAAAKQMIQAAQGRIHYEFDSLNAIATTLPTPALNGIRNNPNVVLVEEDPPRYLFQCTMSPEVVPYGLDTVQATRVWDANNNGAFDDGAPVGSKIKVGIIDSGVYTGHSDFAGVTMGGFPSDWNTDGLGHGTHVTGTIAAQLNGSGVVGVSPGVSIYMVKVFGADGAWIYSSTLLNAAQRCQTAGCKIISMSLGGSLSSRTENTGFSQLYNAGILLVAAAGNDGNTRTSYPAGYASVISVAAVDQNNVVASFSQKNSDVELAAPGVGVLSTVPYCEENTVTVGGGSYAGNYIDLAARGSASGALVDGGLAGATDGTWSGKVVLVERGTYSFYQKVINVQNSGGVACIIYNNVDGDFLGTLSTGPSAIPAISVSRATGLQLQSMRLGQVATVTSLVTPGVSGWAYYDGTSMATPHVSAVAALAWSAKPSATAVEIRSSLQSTAMDLGVAGKDNSYGYGLVQAKAAIEALGGGATTPLAIDSGPTATSVNAKRGTFKITWITNKPATSTANVVGLNSSTDSALVMSHSMTFQGTKGVTYVYTVSSTDATGSTVTASGDYTVPK